MSSQRNIASFPPQSTLSPHHVSSPILGLHIRGRSLVSPRVAPQGGQALENRQSQEARPNEESKSDCGLRALAEGDAVALGHADEGGHGNRAREPENRRDDENDKCDKSMVEASSVKGRQG